MATWLRAVVVRESPVGYGNVWYLPAILDRDREVTTTSVEAPNERENLQTQLVPPKGGPVVRLMLDTEWYKKQHPTSQYQYDNISHYTEIYVGQHGFTATDAIHAHYLATSRLPPTCATIGGTRRETT